ncbi:MAG: alpha-mannosidase, partial [Armatimonadetes bacterium]|nr:alpha-mannosidase [Armatimonadota bacterium]
KRHNRRVEHLLLAAERMGSLAQGLVGRCSPAREIQSAWKALLFTQFHDILAGTSLPEAYRDARDAHGYAAHIAGSAMHGAAQSISGRVDTRGQGDAVVVFNTLPWPVRVPVEIERGSAVVCTAEGEPVTAQAVQPTTVSRQRRSCFVADLPALGYRTYREVVTLGETVSGRRLRVEGCAIENDWWRVSVSGATGCIGAIRDLETGIELLRDPGMALVVLDDPSDTWSHGVGGFGAEIGRFAASRVVSDEQGPVRAALRATAAWGSSWVSHVIRLYRDVPIVEGELRIHWAERRRALKLSLPLAITGGVATYEVPYGCAVRASDATEQPGQQWADLTGSSSDAKAARFGVALLNDCKYGYDARPDELRLTILRSPAYAHHDPATLDPDCEYEYTDQGVQTVRYRLMPHIGELAGNEVTRRAMELNVLPIAVNEFEHDGTLPTSASFISADPGNIVVCVCKEAEDTRGLIVRAYESEGTPTRATLHMPGAGLTWQADFAPMQIRSWLINRCEEPWVKEVNALELTI